ncbi:kumamolisin [Sinomonas cellulolyticus]|uniref:S8 family serine peptidase n=1 Tax=Sinomonas cellulolyticus TaxID=2801916 RepID=A0ABS1K5A8_9MICC|nr:MULTISPECIES: S53 family peptidase [Sinomonas]MBL0706860.1 S8 family serine peptidase [Sinomonas cellulolyticus]GHG52842.1 kumamolisin [Sinomonas sp. KCTC 49339]
MTDAPTPHSDEPRVPLPGSERPPAPGLRAARPADPSERIEVTVVLRRRAPLPEQPSAPLSREALASGHGASDADLQLATETFTRLGAEVLEADAASRRIRLGGTVEVLSGIFGTSLDSATSIGPGGEAVAHRHRTGGLMIPAALDGVVTAVLGLDDRPQARPQFRAIPLAAAGTSYSPPDLGRIYAFPAGTDGSGQTVAILELGGGFGQADLDAYFSGLGLATPSVTAVGVDGAVNEPRKDPQGADGEVLLDVEVVGALAPKADILVYFAPNTDAGFLDALSTAAHATPAPCAISISWGQSEDDWTAQARNAMDQALADAAALGVTVTAAAGDRGSTDGATDGRDHADFPASSPHALGCGGTRLQADPSTGAITSETVWNDSPTTSATGGGYSDVFPAPSWQTAVAPAPAGHASAEAHRKPKPKPKPPTPAPASHGRGVPDVAGVADPQTGYRVRVDGADMVIGGTSAVAPLWAALIARLAQATGKRFGLMQPALYAQPGAFRDVTSGNNGTFHAGPGWDACTGLGSPNGTALLKALGG